MGLEGRLGARLEDLVRCLVEGVVGCGGGVKWVTVGGSGGGEGERVCGL